MVVDNEWVLAFDLGARASGYAFGSEGSVTRYGKYVAKSKGGRGQKLVNYSRWISKVINNLPNKPDRVVIEAPYYRRNVKTFAILNKYVGACQREVFRLLNVEAELVPASLIKSSLNVPKGGTHAERKKNMVNLINRKLGLKLSYHKSNKNKSDDDIADAIALLLVTFKRDSDKSK